MKFKLLIFLFASFIFAASAQAKLHYKNKPIDSVHAATIKGFLYEISHNTFNIQKTSQQRLAYAKALVWLDYVRDASKIYHIDNLKNEEAIVIISTIETIIKVFNGEYGIDPDYAATHWTNLGRRIVVNYSRQSVLNSTTGKPEIKTSWKFELQTTPSRNQTRDLLYRAW